jgi:hypothetical protein
MLSVLVIPSEPVSQIFGKFSPGFVCFQIDTLVLQGAPESLNEDVVLEAPGSSATVPAIRGPPVEVFDRVPQ